MPTTGSFTDLMRGAGHDDQFIDDLESDGVANKIVTGQALTPADIANIEDARKQEEKRFEET